MRWPLGLYRVSGESMLPTYNPGDMLLGLRWFKPHLDQIAVVRHELPLIKRVKRLEQGGFWVEGDNPAASTDSRLFGPVSRAQIEAVIIARLARSR